MHRIAWYVYAGGERIRRTATMRGAWGGDVECSCGWKTNTGGATVHHLRSEIWFHKLTQTHHGE
jgi:hypothetical protein